LVDPHQVVQILVQYQLWKPATYFLVDVIVGNTEEDSDLQTMLFEISFTNMPNYCILVYNQLQSQHKNQLILVKYQFHIVIVPLLKD